MRSIGRARRSCSPSESVALVGRDVVPVVGRWEARRDDPAELSRLHPGVDLTRELEHVASPTNGVRRALGPQARARLDARGYRPSVSWTRCGRSPPAHRHPAHRGIAPDPRRSRPRSRRADRAPPDGTGRAACGARFPVRGSTRRLQPRAVNPRASAFVSLGISGRARRRPLDAVVRPPLIHARTRCARARSCL